MSAKILRNFQSILGAGLILASWNCEAGSVINAVGGAGTSVPKSVNDRALREEILKLGSSESPEYASALDQLSRVPRARVLAILRDDLTAGPHVSVTTLNAITSLRARELLPELKNVARTTEFWRVFASLNFLFADDEKGREELVPIYLVRLKNLLSTTAKVAVLNGLSAFQASLPPETFQDVIESGDYDVRIAAIRHLVATRELLHGAERARRFDLAVGLEPRQARIEALREVPRLPASERDRLKKVFFGGRCSRESDGPTHEACAKAEKSVLRGGNK